MKTKNSTKPKEKPKADLKQKLEIPFILSIWWYMAGIFLLLFGVYILGMHFLQGYVDSYNGEWSFFTTQRPHLTPYSSPQEVRWGMFYIPTRAIDRFYAFAPVSAILGFLAMALRYVVLSAFLKKYQ